MFDACVFWIDGNDCREEDKTDILDNVIPFDEFTLDELLGKVRKTGVYTEERIDARIKEIFREKDSMLTKKCDQVKKLMAELEDEKAKVMGPSLRKRRQR